MISKSSAIPVDPAAPMDLCLSLPESGLSGIGLHFPEGCIGDGEPGQPGPVIINDVTGAVGRANDLAQKKKKNQDFSI